MAFEQLAQLVAEAEAEQQELSAANAALDAARQELVNVQSQVADKQAAVDAARDAAGSERGDVVGKLQQLIAQCQEILTGLQS